eukprot:INCI5875.20.p1 GENE.INCI5875.20~~INCI5875.20.p1  ORF type:complete len:913 (-),score=155.31 INCI5875.20:597-3335(-)
MKREVPTGRVDRDSQLGNKKFVAQYEEVARALDRKHRGVSAEYAASLACDIQQFMEDHLGAHVEAPVMTKLDAKAFRDLEPRGCFHTMLKAALKRQVEVKGAGGDPLDFDFSDVPRIIDVLRAMYHALQGCKNWDRPKLFFDRSVSGARLYRLRKLAKLHGAIVTHIVEECTHIVQFNAGRDGEGSASRKAVYQVTARLGSSALVHWQRYPNSYDRWISTLIAKKPVTEEEPSHPTVVCCSFVEDTHKFNEWMDTVDYELGDDDDWDRGAADVLADNSAEANSRARVHNLVALSSLKKGLAMDGAPTPVKDGEIANSGAAPKKLKFGMSVSSTDAGGDLPYAKRICKASGIKLSLGHSSKPGAEQDPVTAKEDTSLRIHVEDLSKGTPEQRAAKRKVFHKQNQTGLRVRLLRIDSERCRLLSTNVTTDCVERHGNLPLHFAPPGQTVVVETERQRIFDTDDNKMQALQQNNEISTQRAESDAVLAGLNAQQQTPDGDATNGSQASVTSPSQDTAVRGQSSDHDTQLRAAAQSAKLLLDGHAWFHESTVSVYERDFFRDILTASDDDDTVPTEVPAVTTADVAVQVEAEDAAAEKAGLPVHSLRGFRAARNYLVRLYKLDPSRYLTATESRRLLAGDACTIIRLHGFLERHGLVNFDARHFPRVLARYGSPPSFADHLHQVNAEAMPATVRQELERRGQPVLFAVAPSAPAVEAKRAAKGTPRWTEEETNLLLQVVGKFQRSLEMSDWVAVAEEVNRRTTTSDNAQHPGRSAADCCRRFVGLPLVRQALAGDGETTLTATTHAASVVHASKGAVAENSSAIRSQNGALDPDATRELKLERLAVRKEREILKLSSHLLQEQIKLLSSKINRVNEMERILALERAQIKNLKYSLSVEKLNLVAKSRALIDPVFTS